MAGFNNINEPEPSTAPQFGRWYNLTLGSSFKDHQSSSRFCTLRYDFKPASIDKNQPGTLHKSKDNKVTVEFANNQHGRPNVIFEQGSSEDHKDTDAVLFFDDESMRLERLHRAFKRLKYNSMQGESAAAVPGISDASSPPVGRGVKHQPFNKETFHALPVEIERIDVGDYKSSEHVIWLLVRTPESDAKHRDEKPTAYSAAHENSPNQSPDLLLDIINANDDEENAAADGNTIDVKEFDTGNIDVREYDSSNVEVNEYDSGNVEVREYDTTGNYGVKKYDTGIDINKPHPSYSDDDDEIADVDVIDDEADNGPTAAQALMAQVSAEKRENQSSSSSSSSSSSDSESSGSGSSSGDGENSDDETVNSI